MNGRALSRIVAAVALWGLPLAVPTRALAADEADRLIKEGLDLRRAGDDQSAYKLFVQAYGEGHTPRAAAQLGFCEQALGRWADAETHLSEGLRALSSDPWIRKSRAPIEQSLSTVKKQIARIEVVGEPAGAEVLINGAPAGKLPLDTLARVAGGVIEVELRKAGYTRASKILRVEGGQYQKVVIRAEREPETAAAAAERSRAEAAERQLLAPPAPPEDDPSEDSDGPARAAAPRVRRDQPARRGGAGGSVNSLRVAAWVTGGVSLVFLGAGAIELVSASSSLDEFGRTPAASDPTMACGTNLPNYGGARCASLYHDWRQARTIGVAGLVGGGLLAAASLTLFIVSAEDPPGSDQASITCAPTVRDLGFGCVAHF
jgi:hypothetical protein